jgi:hypothetical protein
MGLHKPVTPAPSHTVRFLTKHPHLPTNSSKSKLDLHKSAAKLHRSGTKLHNFAADLDRSKTKLHNFVTELYKSRTKLYKSILELPQDGFAHPPQGTARARRGPKRAQDGNTGIPGKDSQRTEYNPVDKV